MNHLGRYLTDPLVDPPVRVLVVIGANPAVSHPEQQLVLEGLARDDVFTVVHEQVMTDTARFADVVLPATTHFEVDDVTRSYGSFTRHVMPAVIERVGESRTNNEFAGRARGAPRSRRRAVPDGSTRARRHLRRRPA